MDKESTDFIKVRSILMVNRSVDITSDGLYTQEFQDKLNDTDEFIRSKIIIPINESVGLHNWAVKFLQTPSDDFVCDIYSDNMNHYRTIILIISNRVTDMTIELFEYKGTIAEYMSNRP